MADQITVPLLDIKAQYAGIRNEINEVVSEVIESQGFILGPEVKAFEEEIAQYCHTRFAVGCASGTDAILLALMAVGVGAGDEGQTAERDQGHRGGYRSDDPAATD